MKAKTLFLILTLALVACNNAYSPLADVENFERYDVTRVCPCLGIPSVIKV